MPWLRSRALPSASMRTDAMPSITADAVVINGPFSRIISRIRDSGTEDMSDIFGSNNEPATDSGEIMLLDIDIDEDEATDEAAAPGRVTPSDGWLSTRDEDGDADNWSAGFGYGVDGDGESQGKGGSRTSIIVGVVALLVVLSSVAAFMFFA